MNNFSYRHKVLKNNALTTQVVFIRFLQDIFCSHTVLAKHRLFLYIAIKSISCFYTFLTRHMLFSQSAYKIQVVSYIACKPYIVLIHCLHDICSSHTVLTKPRSCSYISYKTYAVLIQCLQNIGCLRTLLTKHRMFNTFLTRHMLFSYSACKTQVVFVHVLHTYRLFSYITYKTLVVVMHR